MVAPGGRGVVNWGQAVLIGAGLAELLLELIEADQVTFQAFEKIAALDAGGDGDRLPGIGQRVVALEEQAAACAQHGVRVPQPARTSVASRVTASDQRTGLADIAVSLARRAVIGACTDGLPAVGRLFARARDGKPVTSRSEPSSEASGRSSDRRRGRQPAWRCAGRLNSPRRSSAGFR